MIRHATHHDAAAICEIYNHYILNSSITFEEQPVNVVEMQRRLREMADTFPWFVFEKNRSVIGFGYASAWKSRCAYRFSAESTLYLHHEHTGQGAGGELLQALIENLEALGLHSILAGISLPNPASIALHEKMGFEQVAHFKEVGRKFDQWIDVGYWELLLETQFSSKRSICVNDS